MINNSELLARNTSYREYYFDDVEDPDDNDDNDE